MEFIGYYTIITVVGLIIGSFLSAISYRLPRQMQYNLAKTYCISGYSRCYYCQQTIASKHNIPIVSYLLLRGHCSYCQQAISLRYPLIETATVCFTVTTVFLLSNNVTGLTLFSALILTWTLICLTIIDIEHQLLPDILVLPLLWLGLLLHTFTANSHDAILGAVLGYLFLWLLGTSYYYFTGNSGIGYGDYKLFAMLGAWFGWQALPTILLLATLLGSTAGILLIVTKQYQRNSAIAFGPYLAFAGWCHLYY